MPCFYVSSQCFDCFFCSLCFTYHMENEKEEETKIKFIETTKYFRSLQINLIMFREQQQQQQNGK